MVEHSDLISEMPYLERLNTEERLKLARKRRSQQLKKWSQREKEYCLMNKRKRSDIVDSKSKKTAYKVHFVPSVMLLEAATRNDIEEVKRLLMLGVSADSTNEDGLTALHQCCIDNCEEMMRLLIEFGANVNAKDSEQWTPLHAAATCGHLHLIKLLIEKDADLLAVNADGNMPYDICEDEQTLDYIEAEMAKRGITQELIDQIRVKTEQQMLFDMNNLVKNDYDINYKDEQGATPLHIAAANGYLNVIEFLVDNNAIVDECDNDLWQPIHAAACWGHIDVVEYLVQNGADLEARTKNGETPFDICEDPDLKSRILQLKSEIDAKKAISTSKLRRSHSTNTRSHSIRRTSIREKSQIAKREAIEEARIWQEKTIESIDTKKDDIDYDSETQFYNDFNNKLLTDSPLDINSIKLKVDLNYETNNHHHYYNNNNNNNNTTNSNLYKSTLIQENPVNHIDVNNDYNHAKSSIPKDQCTRFDTNDKGYSNYKSSNDNHLTTALMEVNQMKNEYYKSDNIDSIVNTTTNINLDSYHNDLISHGNSNNIVTLIDLKKQRSEKHRNNMNNIFSDRIKSTFNDHHTTISINNKTTPTTTMNNYEPNLMNTANNQTGSTSSVSGNINKLTSVNLIIDSSPNTVRKKFRGNPSELIGENEKRGCCIIC